MTTDLSFSGLLSFSATTVTVEASTPAGREFFASMFGPGAVGAELPKTKGADLEVFARRLGLTTEVR